MSIRFSPIEILREKKLWEKVSYMNCKFACFCSFLFARNLIFQYKELKKCASESSPF